MTAKSIKERMAQNIVLAQYAASRPPTWPAAADLTVARSGCEVGSLSSSPVPCWHFVALCVLLWVEFPPTACLLDLPVS